MAKFELGQLLTTPGALDAAEQTGESLMTFVDRHAAGDWGVVDEHDRKANDEALVDGSRLFSVYLLRDGTKLWIITECDRAATTVLLPEDY